MAPGEPHGPGPEHYRQHLDRLIRDGQAIQAERDRPADAAAIRTWQQQCASLIGQLSGGAKSHWLARAFSDAFLVAPTRSGAVTTEVAATEIVSRVLSVLDLASASLLQLERGAAPGGPPAAATDRFAFIADPTLRTGLAEVDRAAQDAFDRGAHRLALVSTCSVLESVITECIQRAALSALAASGAPDDPITTWSFDTRIAVAQAIGCISAGCARLPPSARRYRELLDANGDVRDDVSVSEQEARRARQVLRVILRDLAPGR
jgi:hypothetical protein